MKLALASLGFLLLFVPAAMAGEISCEETDKWTVTDSVDMQPILVEFQKCSQIGNDSKEGYRLRYKWYSTWYTLVFKPDNVAQWSAEAKKAGEPFYIKKKSFDRKEDKFVKLYLVPGDVAKARVEAKAKSSDEPIVKDFDIVFGGAPAPASP